MVPPPPVKPKRVEMLGTPMAPEGLLDRFNQVVPVYQHPGSSSTEPIEV